MFKNRCEVQSYNVQDIFVFFLYYLYSSQDNYHIINDTWVIKYIMYLYFQFCDLTNFKIVNFCIHM